MVPTNPYIDEVIKKYNHIDYLVANAGIGGSASLPHEVSLEEWEKVIGVNQTGINIDYKTGSSSLK